MGLFGPSPEKIRRTAVQEFPNVDWQMNVDWSSGAKLHQLHGALPEDRTAPETMEFAHEVWSVVAGEYGLHPKDGRNGLLDVSVSSTCCDAQRTGTNG
jgi:hypothetical protein